MKAEPIAPFVSPTASGAQQIARLMRRHFQFGWWSLLLFLMIGLGLEALHGFKAGFYLNPSNETRRLMWTLAHAHGTLLALVNIAFALTMPSATDWRETSRVFASRSLLAATVLLPGGFFLGGLMIYGADPGLGIVLVPVGALLLFTAVFLTARALCFKQHIPEKSGVPKSK